MDVCRAHIELRESLIRIAAEVCGQCQRSNGSFSTMASLSRHRADIEPVQSRYRAGTGRVQSRQGAGTVPVQSRYRADTEPADVDSMWSRYRDGVEPIHGPGKAGTELV